MKNKTRLDHVEGTVAFLRDGTKWNLSSSDASKVARWTFADIETEDFGTIDCGIKNLESGEFVKGEKL